MIDQGVGLREIAAQLGVAYTTVRAFRLDPASESYRKPPDDWRAELAKLARARAGKLAALAEELEG